MTGDSLGSSADPLGNSPTMTSPAMSGVGVVLGTAAYMSPEQARGAAVDKRADIWAFGVVLFEMLTGKPCFAGETVTDVLAAVVRSEPDWNALFASTPQRLRGLLQRCLAKDKKQRLHDIADARIELEEAAGAGPEHARENGASGLSRKRASAGERVAWVLFAAAVVTSAYLAWTAYRGHPGDGQPVVSTLVPPAGSVSCFRDGFAVSPEGRKIVFSSLSSNGDIHGLVAPYDVAPDGSKFLVVAPVQSTPVPLTLIQNWKALIER